MAIWESRRAGTGLKISGFELRASLGFQLRAQAKVQALLIKIKARVFLGTGFMYYGLKFRPGPKPAPALQLIAAYFEIRNSPLQDGFAIEWELGCCLKTNLDLNT